MKWMIAAAIGLLSCGQNKTKTIDTKIDSTPAAKTPAKDSIETRIEPTSDQLIIPGEKLGKISLGMDATKLESTLGKPDSSDAAMGKAVLTWLNKTDGKQLKIYTAYKDDQMTDKSTQMIYATSPYFKTIEGFGAGSSLKELQKAYPELKKLKSYSTGVLYELKGKGLSFEMADKQDSSVCTGVIIYQPDRLITSLYVYLHPDLKYID